MHCLLHFRFSLQILTILFLVAAILSACQNGDDQNQDSDDASNDDSADDDSSDDDSVDDDSTPPGERLFAAAGQALLTPNSENHPETIYLGGIIPSRVASGVHDDLAATALALKQGDQSVVLVSLDFLGFSRSRIREIQERLSNLGLDIEHILIASTHTHEAPDTLGVFGPNLLVSGVSPTYMAFIQDSITDLILDIWSRLVPVEMKAATITVNDPLSNYPTLMADSREPELTVNWLSAAQFTDDNGDPVATLVNWHAHPEVMIESTLVSSDFPGYLRQRMNDRIGGECVYISGGLGGLATPTGVAVPARDETGNPVLDEDGQPVYLQDGTWDKARSLGFVIADLAIDGLSVADYVLTSQLGVQVETLLLPVTSPTFILGFLVGIFEFDKQDLVTDQPDICGWFGCSDNRLGMVRYGPLTLLTSPGETFPETLIGRPESTFNYGPPYGPFTFPAIQGLLPTMNAEVPMLMSVCGNEIGYLIPASDYHPIWHADYYEEELCLGPQVEEIYRQAAIDLLSALR